MSLSAPVSTPAEDDEDDMNVWKKVVEVGQSFLTILSTCI